MGTQNLFLFKPRPHDRQWFSKTRLLIVLNIVLSCAKRFNLAVEKCSLKSRSMDVIACIYSSRKWIIRN